MKSNLLPYHTINAGDMSQATITSSITDIRYLDNVGFQLAWTGTPTGTFSFQISQDQTTWVTLPLSPAVTASGSADSAYVDLNNMSAPYIKLVYTKVSGTGTLNVYITAKAV